MGKLGPRTPLQLLDLAGDHRRAVEDVVVVQKVGLEGEDLLHPERPLLVPGAGEAEGLVPGGKLHGTGAGVFRERDGEHLEENAIDVVLGLLLGQAEAVDLHAVAEAAELLLFDTVALAAYLVPELGESAHLAHLGHEADAGVHEERDASHHCREMLVGHLALHRLRGRERIGQFLLRRGARFLQVVGADVHRVPLGHVLAGPGGDVGDHAQAGPGRADIGAAREIFLDDVVLDRARELGDVGPLFLGNGGVERQEPGRGGVDRHRGVHLFEGDIGEERPHVAEMRHRHADLADLAPREAVVAVVAGLCRQVEGHGEPRLPLGEVAAIERVRGLRGRVTGIGTEEPGAVFLRLRHGRWLQASLSNIITT